MEKARIAVLVSGGGTNLQAILDAQGSVITSGSVELVFSNKADAYALERAKNAGVESAVLKRKDFESNEAYDLALGNLLEEKNIDVIVLAGYLRILTEGFTKRFEKRIINIHPSLIPSFCGQDFYGLRVHEAALAKGVKVSGATVHYVNEIPDGGEIIAQKAVEVLPGDTPEVLQRRIMEQAEWILLPQATEMVCNKIISER
ncbi:MAG: phosphoribosylglycinamide formyltransferase [Clostridia bacterium]|nr:phosphoribosylglycinamide formyltransferase [Clostridia bacterium]